MNTPAVKEMIVVDKVWSAVSVGYCLLTHGDVQYVAYYNADRRTVVGMRRLGDKAFSKFVLPSKTDKLPRESQVSSTIQGWDSHNYLTMAVDKADCLHLSGNMHASPLTYFRMEKPGDVTTMKQIDAMLGENEMRTTYPHFMTAPDGELLFHYRDGGSGKGNEIYNVYDLETKTWKRFFDTPFVDGLGKDNAYQNGPNLGPDGWYHLLWMWRATPDASTCHDLSYARSRDLKHWETAGGETLTLPITIESKGTIIDPVPQQGGLLNTVHRIGFDSGKRPVISYHKHDKDGNTQAYVARFEEGMWKISEVSDWKERHIFKGGGSGPSTYGTSIGLGTVECYGEDRLALGFSHWKHGNGLLVFDETTLKPLGVELATKKPARYPAELINVNSVFPGMGVQWREDSGKAPTPKLRYTLRWETLGSNRDLPREKPWPENGELVLYAIESLAGDE